MVFCSLYQISALKSAKESGEIIAIFLALKWIEEVGPLRAVISSDSSSSQTSLKHKHSDSWPDVFIEMQETLYRIQMIGLIVTLVWTPAHRGFMGNEIADKRAKEAAKKSRIDIIIIPL